LSNIFSLKNKNILITGASSGIGKQCAITCSNQGANIILVARDKNRLSETKNRLSGERHFSLSQDITIFSELENTIKASVEEVGKIDGFIHSAGIEKTLPLKMMNSDIYNKIYDVNVIAGFEIAKIIAKNKYSGSNPSFVFIASIRGFLGKPGAIGYCSSKGALISGMKAMALELSRKNIRVNSISPAIVKTKMTKQLFKNLPEKSKNEIISMHPLGLGKPDDVANACIYLLSDASKWITGTNLIVDGGYSAK